MKKMIVSAIGVVVALVVVGIGASWAADLEQPKVYSLQECIALAQRNEIQVLTGVQSFVISKERETQAKSDYYPQVTVGYTPISVHGSTGFGSTGPLPSGPNLQIIQNIYDGGLRSARVDAAKYGVTESGSSLRRTQQTVTYNVTSSYFDALRNQHLADVADAEVTYLEEQRKMVRERIDAGDAAKSDELPIISQLANARVTQISAKNAIRTALITLQSVMGLSPQPSFAIEDLGAPKIQEIKPYETYLAQALSNRPDIVAANASVKIAEASVKEAKIALYPRVISTGQYDLNMDTAFSNTSTNWGVSAGITYDVFNGGLNRAIYKEAVANLTISCEQAAQLRKDISTQIQNAYINVTNASERMEAAQVSLQASQQNFDAQSARYKEGLAITLDLLNAQVDLATAQSNAVQANYDYYVALAQLEYAIGKQGVFNAK